MQLYLTTWPKGKQLKAVAAKTIYICCG